MPSQAQKAYEIIEEMIVSLKLEPGLKISESALCEKIGMGRTPVREALQRLAFEGIVTVAPRSGITISEIDIHEQFRLLEVRRELERILAKRATQLATSQEREKFASLAADFTKAAKNNDENLFILTDRKFNCLMTTAAKNKYATNAMSAIHSQTRRFWYLYFKHYGDLPHICNLHAAVALAVSEHHTEKAQEATHKLLDYVEEYTIRTVKDI